MKKVIGILLCLVFANCLSFSNLGKKQVDLKYIRYCFKQPYSNLSKSFFLNNVLFSKENTTNAGNHTKNSLPMPKDKCDWSTPLLNAFIGIDIPKEMLGADVLILSDWLNGVICLFNNCRAKPFAIIIKNRKDICGYQFCVSQDAPLNIQTEFYCSKIYNTEIVCNEINSYPLKKAYEFVSDCDSIVASGNVNLNKYQTLIKDVEFSKTNNCLAQVTFVSFVNLKK